MTSFNGARPACDSQETSSHEKLPVHATTQRRRTRCKRLLGPRDASHVGSTGAAAASTRPALCRATSSTLSQSTTNWGSARLSCHTAARCCQVPRAARAGRALGWLQQRSAHGTTMTANYACDSGVSRSGTSVGMGDEGARVIARPMYVATTRGGRMSGTFRQSCGGIGGGLSTGVMAAEPAGAAEWRRRCRGRET